MPKGSWRGTFYARIIIYEILMDFTLEPCIKGKSIDQASENAKVACYFIYDFPIALVLFFAIPNFHVWRDYKLMAGSVVFVPPPLKSSLLRFSTAPDLLFFLIIRGEFRGICKSCSCDQVFMQSWFLIMGT